MVARGAGPCRLSILTAIACTLLGGALAAGGEEPQRADILPGLEATARSPDRRSAIDASGLHEHRNLSGREYLIGLPTDFDLKWNNVNRSLLIALHGFDLDPRGVFTAFSDLLTVPDGPILVVPYGKKGFGMPLSWSTRSSHMSHGPDGRLCSNDTMRFGCPDKKCSYWCSSCMPFYSCAPQCVWSTCTDDFHFMSILLDDLEKTYNVDPQKVFLAGFSQGGILTWDVAGHSELAKRFTAVATLHASPQAGFPTQPPTPTSGPWLIGIWGGQSEDSMDGCMPPYSNVPNRPDKSQTTCFSEGTWYYSTAKNATTTYAEGLARPEHGVKIDDLVTEWFEEEVTCVDEGRNGAVLRCMRPTTEHNIPSFGPDLVWRYFLLAHKARFGVP